VNGESTDENNGTASPNVQNRFAGFRPASTHSSTCTTPSKLNESDKPLWNNTNTEQQTTKSSFQNGTKENIYPKKFFFALFRTYNEYS
jgi:hypothetical protein